MGQVFRATDEQLQREVALKVLIAEEGVAPSDEARARMLREARAAAALSHPNVVAIYDVGEVNGLPFLVMELVPGRSFRALSHDPSITKDQWVRWLADVALALGAAHRAGLVHRDVKPDNVMVNHSGTVKVLDFGIARTASTPVESTAPTAAKALETLTKQGLLVGTAQYMAPEQIRGLPLDGRCDQFAWGVMAHELLSGEIPFRGHDTMAQLAAILMDDAPSLAGKIPGVSSRVAEVVQRALRKAPDERFASMEALVEALNDTPREAIPPVRSEIAAERATSADQLAFAEAKTAAMPVKVDSSLRPMPESTSPVDAEKSRRKNIFRNVLLALAVLVVGRSVLQSARFSWTSKTPAQPSASASASAAPSSTAVAANHVLPCEELDAPMPSACASTAVAWCDPDRKLVGCCGPDMVPEGRDGVCGCAPGGATPNGNQACPPGGAKEDYTPKFQAVVRAHFPDLKECYEMGLRESNGLVGRIAIGIKVGPSGDVVSANFKESGLPSAAAQRCVLSTFRAMHFPPPPGGSLGVLYPLSFNPGPAPSASDTEKTSPSAPSPSR